jgi:hypothetical protein
MTANRSAPPGPIVPSLAYRDVAKAVDWLRGAFGFTERLRTPPEPDGGIHHIQLAAGAGAVILGSASSLAHEESLRCLMVRVHDIDNHCARARLFGARILSPPDTKAFGERQYAAEDLEGNRWVFTESVADVPPEKWGAIAADLSPRLDALPRPRLCYLEISAADVHQSAAFYEKTFGWNIRHRDTVRPSFDFGNVSGAWVAGRPPAREPGLLPYIWVDDIDVCLAQAAANGAEIVDPPHPDSPGSTSWIATFRDPAGNLIGLYRETI